MGELQRELKEEETFFEAHKYAQKTKEMESQNRISQKNIARPEKQEKMTSLRKILDLQVQPSVPRFDVERRNSLKVEDKSEGESDLIYRLFIKFGDAMFQNKFKKCAEFLKNGVIVRRKKEEFKKAKKNFDLIEFLEQGKAIESDPNTINKFFDTCVLKLDEDNKRFQFYDDKTNDMVDNIDL